MADNKAYPTLRTEVRLGNNLFKNSEMRIQNQKSCKSPCRVWRSFINDLAILSNKFEKENQMQIKQCVLKV